MERDAWASATRPRLRLWGWRAVLFHPIRTRRLRRELEALLADARDAGQSFLRLEERPIREEVERRQEIYGLAWEETFRFANETVQGGGE